MSADRKPTKDRAAKRAYDRVDSIYPVIPTGKPHHMTRKKQRIAWQLGYILGYQEARREKLHEQMGDDAKCGECGKSAADGWALYCVKCSEQSMVAAAVAEEREACAKVAESYEPICDRCPSGVANAVRARGEK